MSSHFLGDPAQDGEENHRGSDPSSSSEDDEEDQTWEDWVSDSASKRPCKSLFDDTTLYPVEQILEWDRLNHGFDLDAFCKQLCAFSCACDRISPLSSPYSIGSISAYSSDQFHTQGGVC